MCVCLCVCARICVNTSHDAGGAKPRLSCGAVATTRDSRETLADNIASGMQFILMNTLDNIHIIVSWIFSLIASLLRVSMSYIRTCLFARVVHDTNPQPYAALCAKTCDVSDWVVAGALGSICAHGRRRQRQRWRAYRAVCRFSLPIQADEAALECAAARLRTNWMRFVDTDPGAIFSVAVRLRFGRACLIESIRMGDV